MIYFLTYDYSANKIILYDATTFAQVYSISNSDSSRALWVIPDVNGNSYPDIIMEKSSKDVTIRDLKTGSIIYTYSAPAGYGCQIIDIGTTSG